MKPWFLGGMLFLLSSGIAPVVGQSTRSASLDQKVVELKEARSLAALCAQDQQIKECQFAIGEWKPEAL